MEWLDYQVLRNPLWRWLAALGVAVVTVVVIRALKALLRHRLRATSGRTHVRVDLLAIEVLEHTRWFFYLGLGLYLGSLLLHFHRRPQHGIEIGAVLVLLAQIGAWGQHAIRVSVDAWQVRHDGQPGPSTMAAGIAFLGQLALWIVLFLMALSNVGIEITALVAGLGMGGIAAALAVQSVLGDLFAALSIYFDRPFDIGDFIAVADLMGSIEKIGLRSTRLRSLSGEQLILANKDIVGSRIKNYARMRERRIVQTIGVEYGTPVGSIERAPGLLRESVEETPRLRFDRAHFKGFGDSALLFELVYWVLDPDYTVYMDAQQRVNLGIMRRFASEGLVFAFPTQTVHLVQDHPPAEPHRAA